VITAGAYNQPKIGPAVNRVFERLVAAVCD
jgi:hypothetical protein